MRAPAATWMPRLMRSARASPLSRVQPSSRARSGSRMRLGSIVPVVAASTSARNLPVRRRAYSTADQPPIDWATMRTSAAPDARSGPPDRRHSRRGWGHRQWRKRRSRDARRSRRRSGARSARPAATTTCGCRRARARTEAPARCPSPRSGSCSPAFQFPDATSGHGAWVLMLVPWRSFGSGFLDNSSIASARCSSAML